MALNEGGRRKHRNPEGEERSESHVSETSVTSEDERSESSGAPEFSATGLSCCSKQQFRFECLLSGLS
ncbi:MAG: hypothetical protein V5A32_05620, partial [Halovenus sp.]